MEADELNEKNVNGMVSAWKKDTEKEIDEIKKFVANFYPEVCVDEFNGHDGMCFCICTKAKDGDVIAKSRFMPLEAWRSAKQNIIAAFQAATLNFERLSSMLSI